jgi:hypothetical protein
VDERADVLLVEDVLSKVASEYGLDEVMVRAVAATESSGAVSLFDDIVESVRDAAIEHGKEHGPVRTIIIIGSDNHSAQLKAALQVIGCDVLVMTEAEAVTSEYGNAMVVASRPSGPRPVQELSERWWLPPRKSKGEKKRERAFNRRLYGRGNW